MAAMCLLAPGRANADGWIMLSPGPGYRIELSGFTASPRVERQGLSPLDRWFQVAPGGGAVALWSVATGLAVSTVSGVERLHRRGVVTAFRFSPAGDRLAFASAKGIEVLALDRKEPRLLRSLGGVDWLWWTDAGLIARARSKLYVVDYEGNRRTLAELGPGAVVAAAKGRVVYFTGGRLVTRDLASGGAIGVTKLVDRDLVINADLSPDGEKVLFATAKRVYLREGRGPVRRLADAAGVQSLFFSPDGAAYLWATGAGGEVVEKGRTTALPQGTRSARFNQSGGLVLTAEDGVATWDPATGARSQAGGISSDDGVNLAGDVGGGAGVVIFYYKKTGRQKEAQALKFPPP